MQDAQTAIEIANGDHRTPSPRGFAAVHVAPDSSADVPDGQEARLLIVPQRQQAVERLERADRTLHDRLVGAYHWVLVPTQPDPTRLSNHLPPRCALAAALGDGFKKE